MASGPAPRPRPGPRLPGCPRAARPRAAWQFASSSSSSLRPWPPLRPRSPSLSTASCPRKRPGPPPSSVATRSMTGGGCSSPSWTRGSTRGLRACRCASRRGPGRGGAGGGAAGRLGTRRGRSLGAPQAESRSAAERERAPGGGGGQGGRGLGLGRHPGPDKSGVSGAAGRVAWVRLSPRNPLPAQVLPGPGPGAPSHHAAFPRRSLVSRALARACCFQTGILQFLLLLGMGVGRKQKRGK